MYQINSYKTPFWSENSGFMTGRDPLGVQNSSITAYGKLLPGMTNLTLRLRYYGFYTWVLDEFFKKQGGNLDFNIREQHNFIRRAELMIAFIMRYLDPEELSIIGSNFTLDNIEILAKSGEYDIARGADQFDDTVKGSVYWDYRSGALGQYFAGSLSTLDLITIDNKYFTLTTKGKELATSFRKSLSPSQENLFLDQLDLGKLPITMIHKLDAFKINAIKPYSNEWHYYVKLLISTDGIDIKDARNEPTSLRKDSLALLLKYLSSVNIDYNERSFILYEYTKNTDQVSLGASLGWYYYYINEAFHFALETVFWAILIKLDGRPMPVSQFIQELLTEVIQQAESKKAYNSDHTIEEVIISLESKLMHEALEELEQSVKLYSNNIVACTQALELMFLIYIQIDKDIRIFYDFENQYFISRQKGRVSENYEQYVKKNLKLTFKEFVNNTIKQLMNDHVNTAYRKMGNGESNLLKFIIEDGIISHIQTMQPKHTSPRLRTATNFLRDLSLIDTNNLITESGENLLKEITA